jgi:iron complex transport system substrate-binding protein
MGATRLPYCLTVSRVVMKVFVPFFCLLVLIFSQETPSAFSENTMRLLSLAPATTEILFALGLDKEIVGVSSYCDYPPEAKNKEKLGTFSDPNIEKILFLKPDRVFCADQEQAPVKERLEKLGLNVYVSAPKNILELFESIQEIGNLVNRRKEARALILQMQKELDSIAFSLRSLPRDKRLKVFIEIWHDPLMTAGKSSFVDDIITLAGGLNIAHETRRPYSIYSPEEVIKRNPECIIVAYMDKEPSLLRLQKRSGWQTISAVKNKRVYSDISPDWLLRPGPRAVLGIKEIWKRLYENE